MNLSKSQEHYVKAVYELSKNCDGVRSCDIAAKLQLSKASVSNAMKKLEKQGLMHKDIGRRIHLTDAGKREAVRILDKVETIRRFLIGLGVDREVAGHDACAIEHVISIDALCAICRSSGYGKAANKCTKSCSLYLDTKTN